MLEDKELSKSIQEDIQEEMKQFEYNMYRERCTKLPDIKDKDWEKLDINSENRAFIEEFLMESTQLSPKSIKQYKSGLRIFAKWVMDFLNNKPVYQIKKKEFLRYQNFLVRHGMSSKGIKFKRSACSTWCNYLENYYFGEDDRFNGFRNFVKGVENPAPNEVYKKVLITQEEYKIMKETLLELNRTRDYTMLVVCMETGMRGGELRKLKRSEAYKEIDPKLGYVLSDTILGKGRGGGKPLEYMINQTALNAIKEYEKTRDKNDGCEYLFVSKYDEKINQVSESHFESAICHDILSDSVSRRINEHLMRATCATWALLRGVPEKLVSKYILHHENLQTLVHYDLRDFESERSQIFATAPTLSDEQNSNEI